MLAVADPPTNVPVAPLPGAVNVTVTPLTGFPPLLVTVACNAVANAVPSATLCSVPPLAVIVDAEAPLKAAPFNVTFPLVPELITHVTVKVFPALAAE
jgi:hypothetical protein